MKVGDTIERRQIRMFAGDLYTLCIVEVVRPDKFFARPRSGTFDDGSEGMWFEIRMEGKTWR